MNDILKSLEETLAGYSKTSELPDQDVQLLPADIRLIHSYKIFGPDLLAIPAELIIKEHEDEFEITVQLGW